MDSESPETMIDIRSTIHRGQVDRPCECGEPDVRHATVVINRLLRSSRKSGNVIQDRILSAASVLKAAAPTETAFAGGMPVDVASRIAARIVRRLDV